MDLYVSEHLKIDSQGRILFYSIDFTSPGYVVPSKSLKRRITVLHRLHRLSSFLPGALGIGVAVFLADRLDWGVAYFVGFAAYHLVERPLEAWWPWYAERLANTLEKAHD